MLAALVVAGVTACGGGDTTAGRPTATPTSRPTTAAPDRPAPSTSPEDRTVTVARRGAVELVVPSAYALLVGFHEGGSAALDLEVVAPVDADHAAAGVRRDTSPDDAGPTVIVLPGRRRGTAATTAMDVVVPEGRPIVSPLDGTVVAVADYLLYGRHEDVRIVIEPAGDPEVVAIVLHVRDPRVVAGDELRAGETVIADSARILPETSQIDRYTRRSVREDAPPHVHVELHRAG